LGRIQKKMAGALVQRQNVTKVLGSSVPSSRCSSSAGKILISHALERAFVLGASQRFIFLSATSFSSYRPREIRTAGLIVRAAAEGRNNEVSKEREPVQAQLLKVREPPETLTVDTYLSVQKALQEVQCDDKGNKLGWVCYRPDELGDYPGVLADWETSCEQQCLRLGIDSAEVKTRLKWTASVAKSIEQNKSSFCCGAVNYFTSHDIKHARIYVWKTEEDTCTQVNSHQTINRTQILAQKILHARNSESVLKCPHIVVPVNNLSIWASLSNY
jgi:hypothetical protein